MIPKTYILSCAGLNYYKWFKTYFPVILNEVKDIELIEKTRFFGRYAPSE